jgi:hypothetical protein
MKSTLVLALTLSLFAGCKKGSSASSCSSAVSKGVDKMIAARRQKLDEQGSNLPPELKARMDERSKMMDEVAGPLKQTMTNRCTEDKWSADVLKCYDAASSMEEIRACGKKLPAEQQQKLQADVMQVMMKTMGGQPGGMGGMPGHPDGMGGDPMHGAPGGAPGQNGAPPSVPPTEGSAAPAAGSAAAPAPAGSAAAGSAK